MFIVTFSGKVCMCVLCVLYFERIKIHIQNHVKIQGFFFKFWNYQLCLSQMFWGNRFVSLNDNNIE